MEHGDCAKVLGVVITRELSKFIALFIHKNPQLSYHLEKFVYTTFGRNFHQVVSSQMTAKIKKQLGKEYHGNKFLICGHSHGQQLDLSNNFIGTGMVNFGLGQYVIIENGNVIMKEEVYK